jgi:hypothetical protein
MSRHAGRVRSGAARCLGLRGQRRAAARAPGNGVTAQLGHRAFGRASLADLHDTFAPDALAGLAPGRYVRCRVLGPAGGAAPPGGGAAQESKPGPAATGASGDEAGAARALRVSLRASRGGEWEGRAADPGGDPAPELLSLGDLKLNQPVRARRPARAPLRRARPPACLLTAACLANSGQGPCLLAERRGPEDSMSAG